MRKSVRKLLIGSFKLLVVLTAMICLYPILVRLTSERITALSPGQGNWLAVILTLGVYVYSILGVCFMSGLLFPRDSWIVRPAVLIYVLCDFARDIHVLIRAQIYFSTNFGRSLGYPPFGYEIIKYALIILLTYWLSRPLHRCGAALRARSSAEQLRGSKQKCKGGK